MCPLTLKKALDNNEGFEVVPCLEQKCAWWTNTYNCCALVTIAGALVIIQKHGTASG